MRGDDRVLDYLNRSLRSELTAINQYWLHYRIFDNWGYKDLAKKWREEFDRGNAPCRSLNRAYSFSGRIP